MAIVNTNYNKTSPTSQLWTCGINTYGQLGDETTTKKSSPVQTVAGGSDWKQSSIGYTHSAAIKTDGTLWLWGNNNNGQLGDGTTASKSSPIQTVAGGTDWKQVACGYSSTMAIKTDGTLWTWGRNTDGQLGDGTTTKKSSPVQTIAGGTDWKQIGSGQLHVCAIKTDGSLWGWGNNNTGQLGDGTTASKSSPIQTVAGGTDWKQVACGYAHSTAIKTDNTLWTWGYNAHGELGDNTVVNKSSPIQTVAGGTDWKYVSSDGGSYHVAAMKYDGTLWLWGRGSLGQIGNNSSTDRSSPVQTVAGGTDWKHISTGGYHTIAAKTDGSVWSWGNNTNGQLGDGTAANKSSPVQVTISGILWKQVIGGNLSTGIIAADTPYDLNGFITKEYLLAAYPYLVPTRKKPALWTWGYNNRGQLGDNSIDNKSSPVQTVAGGIDWRFISNGTFHSGAIKTDGTLWSWGYNSNGQLGDNTITNKSSPVQTVAGGTDWKSISCGGRHTVAIKNDGTLWSWGLNSNGQLGDNTITNKSSPIQTVAGGNDWKYAAAGGFCTYAIKNDGTLWSWGLNSTGQLGDDTVINKSSPVQTVAGGTDWLAVYSLDSTTAAVKTDGTLWTWGSNNNGQLGDNTVINKSSPVQTVAGGTDWKQAACGQHHTAAIKTDGTLWTWGRNIYGELGDNTTTNRSSPVQTVVGRTDWKYVTCGYSTYAIKTDGSIWCCGYNSDGELGDNTIDHKSSPVQTVAGGTNWKSISANNFHVSAISEGDNW